MLIQISNSSEVDDKKIMQIYAEGNLENADYFYPQMENRIEAVKKVENDFSNFIKDKFLNGKNCYYILEVDGIWVSAMRLYNLENNFYYIEALETAPNYRNKGYATQLLTQVIDELKTKGNFRICDCVGKKNMISLHTHKKCGFRIVSDYGYNYIQKEIEKQCYNLEYSF